MNIIGKDLWSIVQSFDQRRQLDKAVERTDDADWQEVLYEMKENFRLVEMRNHPYTDRIRWVFNDYWHLFCEEKLWGRARCSHTIQQKVDIYKRGYKTPEDIKREVVNTIQYKGESWIQWIDNGRLKSTKMSQPKVDDQTNTEIGGRIFRRYGRLSSKEYNSYRHLLE
jgi:hypothetical protein